VPTKKFVGKFLQHGDVRVQQFIYRGTTVAMGISDISRAVMNIAMGGCHHQNVANVVLTSIAPF
jgi:hypothetical protein